MKEMEQATVDQNAPNTKEMVRKLQETAGVANATLENLHIQGEQMNRIIDMNDSHTDTLYSAERLTRELSFSGRISNIFRKKYTHTRTSPQLSTENPEKKKERKEKERKEKEEKKDKNDKKEKKEKKKEKQEEELSPEDRIWKERSDPSYKPPPQKDLPAQQKDLPPDLTPAQVQLINQQDGDLDEMANILGSLKEMAQITTVELQHHSKKIDVMDEQIEKNLHSTKKTTAKLSRYG